MANPGHFIPGPPRRESGPPTMPKSMRDAGEAAGANDIPVSSPSKGIGAEKRQASNDQGGEEMATPPKAKMAKTNDGASESTVQPTDDANEKTPRPPSGPNTDHEFACTNQLRNNFTADVKSWDNYKDEAKIEGSFSHEPFEGLQNRPKQERLFYVILFCLITKLIKYDYFLCIPPAYRPTHLPRDPLNASSLLLRLIGIHLLRTINDKKLKDKYGLEALRKSEKQMRELSGLSGPDGPEPGSVNSAMSRVQGKGKEKEVPRQLCDR